MSDRTALFISHANPEDNPFAIWLGAKLAAVGYEVWADVLRIRGGDDWQRLLEDAIRKRACKVLLAANEISVEKQGVRNEIQIASDTGKELADSNFIIPLRLRSFKAPFLTAQSQHVDFEKGWASGLMELFRLLEEEYKVPRRAGNADAWMALQLMHGKKLIERPERLTSSWLEVRRLPEYFYFYPDPQSNSTDFPSVPFRDGILTCDKQDIHGRLSCRVENLLSDGWPKIGLDVRDARRRFADIANQSLAKYFESKGLASYEMSNKILSWWVDNDGPKNKVQFKWPESAGSRKIQGVSQKRRIRWHYGVSASYLSVPLPHFRLKSRLVFTQDGKVPIASLSRAHQLRRSFAKGWRNARWRDMMLAFLFWLGDGTTVLDFLISNNEALVVSLPPMIFSCPIAVEDKDELEDEEDPDVEDITNDESEYQQADDESAGHS